MSGRFLQARHRYASWGDHLRATLDLTAGATGIVVLFYGAGFALASFVDGLVDRFGPYRMLPVAMLLVGGVYILLIPATQAFYTATIVAAVWGFTNHIYVNLIILLMSKRDVIAHGTLMGLETTVTYTSIFLGPLILGALYPIGFHVMAMVAPRLLVAVAITAIRFGQIFDTKLIKPTQTQAAVRLSKTNDSKVPRTVSSAIPSSCVCSEYPGTGLHLRHLRLRVTGSNGPETHKIRFPYWRMAPI